MISGPFSFLPFTFLFVLLQPSRFPSFVNCVAFILTRWLQSRKLISSSSVSSAPFLCFFLTFQCWVMFYDVLRAHDPFLPMTRPVSFHPVFCVAFFSPFCSLFWKHCLPLLPVNCTLCQFTLTYSTSSYVHIFCFSVSSLNYFVAPLNAPWDISANSTQDFHACAFYCITNS